jgi:hypothetical protein
VGRRLGLEPVLLELRPARNGSFWSPTDVKRHVKRLCSSRPASYTMRHEWEEYPFKRIEVTFLLKRFVVWKWMLSWSMLLYGDTNLLLHTTLHNTIVVHYQLSCVSLNIRHIEKYLA